MINLLLNGQVALFFLIVIALVISLSFHEFGHAATAKLFGDDTAQRMGRLTLNPLAHVDALGLLMVVFVGFGWAKPVPTNPRNFNSRWADLFVSAAGPGMNLLLAFVTVNVYSLGMQQDWGFLQSPGAGVFFYYLATINLILMLFNLIPLGALDGHYMLPYILDARTAEAYRDFNERYGNMLLMGLVLLSMIGVPIFGVIFGIGRRLLPYLVVL
jgi:Zn-dependent protease